MKTYSPTNEDDPFYFGYPFAELGVNAAAVDSDEYTYRPMVNRMMTMTANLMMEALA